METWTGAVKKRRTGRKLPQILSKDDVLNILNAIPSERDRILTELIYRAGLRISEALNLKKEDFKADLSAVFVRQGKGKKDRWAIIIQSESFKATLNKILNNTPNGYVFRNKYGKRLSPRYVQKILAKVGRKLGISLHPHMLRHTHATELYNQGAPLEIIKTQLGHANLNTTLIYAHIGIERIKDSLKEVKL